MACGLVVCAYRLHPPLKGMGFRSLRVNVDVEVEQGVSVLVNQGDCEVGLIDPSFPLDDWREIVDTPLRR